MFKFFFIFFCNSLTKSRLSTFLNTSFLAGAYCEFFCVAGFFFQKLRVNPSACRTLYFKCRTYHIANQSKRIRKEKKTFKLTRNGIKVDLIKTIWRLVIIKLQIKKKHDYNNISKEHKLGIIIQIERYFECSKSTTFHIFFVV